MVMSQLTRRMALCLGLAATTWGAADARAADFYKDRQINFVVSSSAGGGYDGFARMIARYLPKYIPGEPTIVVQNMPGAGGLRAANWLYNVAPKDGLTIGMINNTLVFDPLYGNDQAQFDPRKFNWLGTPSRETGLLIVWHTVPVQTLDDAKKHEIVLAASGAGSTPAFYARVLADVFDLKVKIVHGYKGQTDSFLAMERGENDGNASPFWASLTSNYPHWLTEKKIRPLVYYGSLKNPDIPAPHALDVLTDPEKRAVIELAQAGLGMGRPIAAPPGVDASKIEILRKAISDVFKDPAYQQECQKTGLDCATPSSGVEMLTFVERIYASPASAIDKISNIYMLGKK